MKSEIIQIPACLSMKLAGFSWLQTNPLVSSFQWHIHHYIEVVPAQDEGQKVKSIKEEEEQVQLGFDST